MIILIVLSYSEWLNLQNDNHFIFNAIRYFHSLSFEQFWDLIQCVHISFTYEIVTAFIVGLTVSFQHTQIVIGQRFFTAFCVFSSK